MKSGWPSWDTNESNPARQKIHRIKKRPTVCHKKRDLPDGVNFYFYYLNFALKITRNENGTATKENRVDLKIS
jgi:hypothetical protein